MPKIMLHRGILIKNIDQNLSLRKKMFDVLVIIMVQLIPIIDNSLLSGFNPL